MTDFQSKNSRSSIRVLHDLHSLQRGGAETWLVNLLRRYENKNVHFDFAVCDSGKYDDEVKEHGSTLHRVPTPQIYFRYLKEMQGILASGKYDVLHCHRVECAGDLMKIAKQAGIRCRICHVHDTSWMRGRQSLLGTMRYWRYVLWCKKMNEYYSTDMLACSRESGIYYYGHGLSESPKAKVYFCGTSLDAFDVAPDPSTKKLLQQKYSLEENSIIIGTVGTMDKPKNHGFLIKVFSELSKRDDRYVLFIAGDGPHRTELESLVDSLGLQNRVIMPGVCTNIPELETQLFDVFCLPSLFEGLPVSMLEAAAAGLHTVCSDVITQDILGVIPNHVTTVGLDASLCRWADALEEGIVRKRSPKDGCAMMRNTPFNIERSAQLLADIYRNRLA